MSRIPGYFQQRLPKVDVLAQDAEAVADILLRPVIETSALRRLRFSVGEVRQTIAFMEEGPITDDYLWSVCMRLPEMLPEDWRLGFRLFHPTMGESWQISSVDLIKVG